MQLQYEEKAYRFLFFITDQNNTRIAFSEWENIKNEFISEIDLLENLKENSKAKLNNDGDALEITSLELLNLDPDEKKILGLPHNYPYYLYIELNGLLHKPDCRFDVSFKKFIADGAGDHLPIANKTNATIQINTIKYLFTLKQFKVLYELNNFDSLPQNEKTYEKNLEVLNAIKNLANDGSDNIIFNESLKNENVFIPNKLDINIESTNDVLKINPLPIITNATINNIKTNLTEDENADFIRKFDKFPTPQPNYTILNNNGIRTRIVTPKEIFEPTLNKIKKINKNKDEILDVIENPDKYFDGDIVNLENFSERVIGIEIYKPKFYPFVTSYKTQWLPGFAVQSENSTEPHIKIKFKTEEELDNFTNANTAAQEQNKKSFIWNDNLLVPTIPNEEINNFREQAKEQFKNPTKKIIKQTEVFIIKENIDSDEYSEVKKSPSRNYTYPLLYF